MESSSRESPVKGVPQYVYTPQHMRTILVAHVYLCGPISAADASIDIAANFGLLERAVAQFDTRFTLRALRSISSLRKRLSGLVLSQAILLAYSPEDAAAKALLDATGEDVAAIKGKVSQLESSAQLSSKWTKPKNKDVVPEIEIYLGILIQVRTCARSLMGRTD